MNDFNIYDSTTADTLERGDIIFMLGEHVELTSVEDNVSVITVGGTGFASDEFITADINPDERIDLWLIS